ncbi:MAG: efflux RND transporter periplasmic adaptor subunit [Acidobacteria bacterium]|nr:efflux RND transporter periplasmic adaptor subunit [Acidobacteriota bacterium]
MPQTAYTCLLLAFLPFFATSCKKPAPPAAKADHSPISVRTSTVRARHIQRIVESVGTLYPYDEVLVSAEIEGKVDQVNVDLGDSVTQGQVLVHVSDEEQRYVLAQNEAQLRMSLERLGLKDEKDRVADVKQTPDVRRSAADLLEARQRFARTRQLVEQGIGARSDLDQVSARFQAAQAAYDTTVNQTRNLIQEVERSKAQVDLQRKKLRDTSVRAPFAAHVKERQVAVGLYVRPNAPLMTLVKIDPIRLRLEVPERMAPWIRNGQMMQVGLEAFLDRKFTGKVWRIAPTVDQTKRTFVVEALISNPKGELKPGSYARATLPTDKSERIMVVPARALNYVLGSNKAYVVHGGIVEAREVKLGDRFETEVEIIEGLKEGEDVATTSLARLDTGVKVTVTGTDDTTRDGKPLPTGRESKSNSDGAVAERKAAE